MSKSTISKRVVGTGAAIAVSAGIGLAMTTAPAHADIWDRVAACESGGNWHISGNGFHGGLQFTQSTWRANGGRGSAQNASKSEQKRIARRVLKTQGAHAWPVCSRKAGLTDSNGGASSYSSSRGSYHHKSYKSYRSHKTYRFTTTKKTYYHHTSHTARHSSGYTAPSHTSYTARHASGTRITIHTGDTLFKLAARHHVSGGWRALWKMNPQISNPNLIFAGHSIYV